MFDPGTRVEWVGKPDPGGPPLGAVGTVICTNDHGLIGVDWDRFSKGHSLGMKLPSKSGWWTDTKNLKTIDDDDEIVIQINPETLFDFILEGGECDE